MFGGMGKKFIVCRYPFYKLKGTSKQTVPEVSIIHSVCRSNIVSKCIIYMFFNFECGFCGYFPMLFPKSPASCCKRI